MHWLFSPWFELLGSPVSGAESLAFVLALWMVACNMRVHALAWPLAILSSALYGALFWNGQLYGEASLQLMFIALAFWGWWQWLRGHDHHGAPLQVRRLTPRGQLQALIATLLAWPALGVFLDRMTDSPLPYWDALPTVGSVLGQYLLARKYLENWWVWVLVNAVSVSLFAYKGWWLTVVLYAMFIPLSLMGLRAWQSRLDRSAA